MVESISALRQMMAESKFLEVQHAAEMLFSSKTNVSRKELVPIFLEALLSQKKHLPTDLLIEASEDCIGTDVEQAVSWMELFPKKDLNRFYIRFQKLKIQIADAKGRTEELYKLISDYQVHLFATKKPHIPDFIHGMVKTYFPNDFNLALQRLGTEIQIEDFAAAEVTIRKLILATFEQSNPRSINAKFNQLSAILETIRKSSALDMYRSLCNLFAKGVTVKNDYKKLAEVIIFFDEFKFQTVVLELLQRLSLDELALKYSVSLRENPEYDFVYFDKFFPRLKKYFVTIEEKIEDIIPYSTLTDEDLKLTGENTLSRDDNTSSVDLIEEETHFIHLLNHQEHTQEEYFEIATTFIHARMPKVALKAIELASEDVTTAQEFLKVCYLKITALMQLKDYRFALDTCIEATASSTEPEDILSFLYVQAEILMKLDKKKSAKKILKKIQSIDGNYRLTKERLDKLNEI